jgi:hypothetical protein
MDKDKVRVMRILVYEGPRKSVEDTLKHSMVPLEGSEIIGELTIKSTIVDKFPEVLDKEVTNDPDC